MNRTSKLQKVIDSSLDVMCTLNKEWKFTSINKASFTEWGYYPEELIGKDYMQLIYKKDSVRCRRKLASIVEVDRVINFEGRLIKKNGSLVPIIWFARWEKKEGTVYCVAKDATVIKESQRKLVQSEQRFKSLVESGSDMIGIIDIKGNYIFVSENVKHLLGHHAEDMIGKNAFDFIHPEDAAAMKKVLVSLKSEKVVDGPPFRFKSSDGGWQWIEAKMTNQVNNPAIGGLVINSRDVTDKRALQEQLNHETEIRQKKLTAAVIKGQEKERQTIARELHDNVNQILATVKLFNEASLNPDEANRNEFIRKSIGYLNLCMEEIRNISKALSLPSFDHISFMESVSDMVNSINAANKIKIFLTVTGIEEKNYGEEILVATYRILQEHLNNVLKHSEASELRISISVEKTWLCMKIQDNGKGFDVKQKRKGIGVTNMISRAEALNGFLELDSSKDKGCKMFVKFPLYQEA